MNNQIVYISYQIHEKNANECIFLGQYQSFLPSDINFFLNSNIAQHMGTN